jgi:large subunit ribosomal protein L15
MDLSNLRPPTGAKHSKKRVGRGQGSGNGHTAGRGHKGAKSRSGFKFKRGFHTPFRVEFDVVNIDTLAERFDAGAVVTPEALVEAGLVTGNHPVKVLARGEVSKALTIRAHKFSGKAAEKIAAAGGQAEALA